MHTHITEPPCQFLKLHDNIEQEIENYLQDNEITYSVENLGMYENLIADRGVKQKDLTSSKFSPS